VTRRFICLALSSILILPAAALAHEGHDHKLMGTIVSVTDKKIVIKTADGPEKSAEITPLTTLHKGKDKGAQADLKAGLRVVLNVGAAKEPLKAKDIQYAAATTTTTATAKK